MRCRPPPSACSYIAQTFGTRSGSLKNRALGAFFFDFQSKIQGVALKVLFVGGVVTEPVAPPIFENRAPVRDILNILRYSDFINIQNCSPARVNSIV